MYPHDLLRNVYGVQTIVITYSGSNDEGYVDEVSITSPADAKLQLSYELTRDLTEWAYEVLEAYHAGWEINEGAHGDITIDLVQHKAFLHHGEIVEQTEWHDREVA